MDQLRILLTANGSFSVGSGLVLLFGTTMLDSALGLDSWFLAGAGLLLAGYGALLHVLARRARVRSGARFATAMDVGWVVGAAVILLAFPAAMTTVGRVGLAAVSLVVAGLGVMQLRGLRRLAGA